MLASLDLFFQAEAMAIAGGERARITDLTPNGHCCFCQGLLSVSSGQRFQVPLTHFLPEIILLIRTLLINFRHLWTHPRWKDLGGEEHFSEGAGL